MVINKKSNNIKKTSMLFIIYTCFLYTCSGAVPFNIYRGFSNYTVGLKLKKINLNYPLHIVYIFHITYCTLDQN